VKYAVAFAALLAASVFLTPAHAGSYSGVVYPANYEVKKYENTKVVILEYVPLFAVGYTPPSPDSDAVKRLEAKIAELEARLAARPNTVTSSGLDVLFTHCAACHTGATSRKKDGVPVILFESAGKLTDKLDLVQVLLAVEDDHMPPGKPLTDSEKKALREFVRLASKKSP
jgi:hypothetical protein